MSRGLWGFFCAGLLATATSAPATDRAVWTWEKESYAMLGDAAVALEARTFLEGKGIGTIYLYADAFRQRNLVATHPQLYRGFIRRMHRHGLRVHALLGSYYLHTERYVLPEHRAEALAMLQRVLDYNAAAAPHERFDGVSLDIEPHLLGEWSEHRDALLLNFIDLSQALASLKRVSGQALELGAAIPFWFDGIVVEWNGAARPASEHLIDLYDYVVLMDYRNRAEGRDGMIAHAARELDYAKRHGRKVVIGVEITPNDIPKVTFDGASEEDLERELRRVEKAYRRNPAFAGFALHHYRTYRQWLEHPLPE
ncbi:MAG TPA: hypothetical protein VM240_10885 [Verrucomicrobiae bacterium]|nr:hypothetical protein [Verrucomicrobiae bacterium]